MKYSFTNYYDLKEIERIGSWSDKQKAKEELKKREKKHV